MAPCALALTIDNLGEASELERGTWTSGGCAAFAELGIEVRCFRPPGGALSERSPALLREAGIGYVSPAGSTFGMRDGLVYVPFGWQLVDAYHLMERFSGLRARLGDSTQPADPQLLAERFSEEQPGDAGGDPDRVRWSWATTGPARDDLQAPVLPGRGESDDERYLRTDELLALQKTPDEHVHHDELVFQTVHHSGCWRSSVL